MRPAPTDTDTPLDLALDFSIVETEVEDVAVVCFSLVTRVLVDVGVS